MGGGAPIIGDIIFEVVMFVVVAGANVALWWWILA
jgi:predicted RNA-binding protein